MKPPGLALLVGLILLLGVVLLLWGCLGAPKAENGPASQPAAGAAEAARAAAEGAEAAEAAAPEEAFEAPYQYPIAPGIWYPGDGPLPEHAFKYYRIRCWPGCHDPNSAPQPHP